MRACSYVHDVATADSDGAAAFAVLAGLGCYCRAPGRPCLRPLGDRQPIRCTDAQSSARLGTLPDAWVGRGARPRTVAERARSCQAHLVTDGSGARAPVDRIERRFWAELTILAAPIFLSMTGVGAVLVLTHGETLLGTFVAIIWLVAAAATLREPYVAILGPDGSLTFKALTLTITTTAESVHRVRMRGRSAGFAFDFDNRRAVLGEVGGRELARYLLERNPTIQVPKILRRRGT